jgi:hypothetical protein
VPGLGAECAALGCEQSAVDSLDLQHIRPDHEPRADRVLEVSFRLPE